MKVSSIFVVGAWSVELLSHTSYLLIHLLTECLAQVICCCCNQGESWWGLGSRAPLLNFHPWVLHLQPPLPFPSPHALPHCRHNATLFPIKNLLILVAILASCCQLNPQCPRDKTDSWGQRRWCELGFFRGQKSEKAHSKNGRYMPQWLRRLWRALSFKRPLLSLGPGFTYWRVLTIVVIYMCLVVRSDSWFDSIYSVNQFRSIFFKLVRSIQPQLGVCMQSLQTLDCLYSVWWHHTLSISCIIQLKNFALEQLSG